MSDLAIVKVSDCGNKEVEQLRDELQEFSDENDVQFLITNADISVMNERELKEYLGEMVGMLEYNLENR